MTTPTTETRTPPGGRYQHWQSLGDGFLLSLIVVGPAFLFEELWRGRPMIDQPGAWWVVPAAIMAGGFFAGGRLAGRARRSVGGAFIQGLLVAGLTLVMIFVADMIRRVVLVQHLNWGVMALWLGSAMAGLLLGGLGGLSGRRSTLTARKRNQMERFH
jgi:hypothetical protein